jgi:stage II sporulation protein M
MRQASLAAIRRDTWRRAWHLAHAWAHTFLFLAGVSLCGLLFGGVVAGQLNSGDAYVLGRQLELLLNTAANHQLAAPSDLWWQRAFHDTELLGLLWLFGISVMGLPLVTIAVFLRSFTVGFTAAFTILSLGWKGVWAVTLLIFAHQLLSLPAVVLAGCAAIRFSGALLQRKPQADGMARRFLTYTAVFAGCAVLIACGAGLQAVLAPHVLAGIA